MILNTVSGLIGSSADPNTALIGTLVSAIVALCTVVGYVIKMNIKLNKSIVEQNQQLKEVIVQNTVAFKDLQSEIRILSESQRTFLPIILKQMAQ